VAGLAGVFLAGILVDRNGWLTTVALVGAQAVALAGQFVLGGTAAGAVATIAGSGFALAALSAALGVRVLEVAPGGSDMAAAGISTAFNVGITGGALLGSVLLTGPGVRSTALAGSLLTVAALAVVLAEPALARRPVPPVAAS
jgi:predicted MFS family arabinose efflux permease